MTERGAGGVDVHVAALRRTATMIRRWWHMRVIGSIEHQQVADRIAGEADWTGRFAFMTLMSAGIAVMGLLQSSAAVVIGAMLISPLMGPIIALGFGVAETDWKQVATALRTLALGSLLAIVFAASIVFLSPLQAPTAEILARTRPTLFDLLVAILSALAGAYAAIRGRGETIVGVAIATALMPPLATVGFGLAVGNRLIWGGALGLFLTNLLAIALAAMVMARLFGFGSAQAQASARWQAVIVTVLLATMAVPLGLSLKQIAWEGNAARQARAVMQAYFGPGARIDDLSFDFQIEPIALDAVALVDRYRIGAAEELGERVTRAVRRPVRVAIEQVVIPSDASALAAERAVLEAAAARDRDALSGREAAELTSAMVLATGAAESNVWVDTSARRVRVLAPAREAVSLAELQQLEQQARQRWPGWAIEVVPPRKPLPPLAVDGATASLDDATTRAALVQLWALKAWGVERVSVSGAGAELVRDVLTVQGIDAAVEPGAGHVTIEPMPAASPAP